MSVDFDRLNRETHNYNNRNIDRFNESTKGNYNRPNVNELNGRTYYSNNGQYSNHYNHWGVNAVGEWISRIIGVLGVLFILWGIVSFAEVSSKNLSESPTYWEYNMFVVLFDTKGA